MEKLLVKQAAVVSLGAAPNQVPLIRKAAEEGFFVIAVDRRGDAPGFRHAHAALNVSTHDTDAVVDALSRFTADCHLRGVLARTTGQALYTASAVSRAFSVPGISDTVARVSTEKAGLREFLAGHGVLVPPGKRVAPGGPDDPGIPLPWIVKPDFTLTGKKDIYLVTDKRSFDASVTAAAGSSSNEMAEVQQYVEGIDVSCMFFSNRGNPEPIVFWDELVAVSSDGTISGLGVSTPSVTCGTAAAQRIEKTVKKVASLFPETAAILVLSLRVDSQQIPHVIELHADLGGDLILDILLPASLEGFDPWGLVLQAATEGAIHPHPGTCVPTVLYYGDAGGDPVRGHHLIQEGTPAGNLVSLDEIVRTGRHDIAVGPGHLEWLLRHTGGRETSP